MAVVRAVRRVDVARARLTVGEHEVRHVADLRHGERPMLHDARLHGPFVGEGHALARLDDDEHLIQQWGEPLRVVTGVCAPGRARARGSVPAAAVGHE